MADSSGRKTKRRKRGRTQATAKRYAFHANAINKIHNVLS